MESSITLFQPYHFPASSFPFFMKIQKLWPVSFWTNRVFSFPLSITFLSFSSDSKLALRLKYDYFVIVFASNTVEALKTLLCTHWLCYHFLQNAFDSPLYSKARRVDKITNYGLFSHVAHRCYRQ